MNNQNNNQRPFIWSERIQTLNEEQVQGLAKWRCYRPEFVQFLQSQNLIGMFNGDIALPVKDNEEVIGCHYRVERDRSWRYGPKGIKLQPLIIGDLSNAEVIYVFESQWDAFALMDALQWDKQPFSNIAIIITRGAGNGNLIKGLCHAGQIIYLFSQNDKSAQRPSPAERCLQDICKHTSVPVIEVKTPPEYKDLNDWTKDGGTEKDINLAIQEALKVFQSELEKVEEAVILGPFPLEVLPPRGQRMVEAVTRKERASSALSGCCILGITSASIGKGLQIESRPDEISRANLYIFPIAESGTGKSKTLKHFLKPFLDYEGEARNKWKKETPALKAKKTKLEKAINDLNKELEEAGDSFNTVNIQEQILQKRCELEQVENQLLMPRLFMEDATEQKLEYEMQFYNETMACISDDGRQVIDNILGRNRSKGEIEDGFWTKAWTGSSHRVNRMNDRNVDLKSPCLSALILVQPDKLYKLVSKNELSVGGLLPRILFCVTGAKAHKIKGHNVSIDSNIKAAYENLIKEILEEYHKRTAPYTIKPTDEARDIIDDYHDELVDKRNPGGNLYDINSFAARWAEQAWRIALILHVMEYGNQAHHHPLGKESAQGAVKIMEWFATHQTEMLYKTRDKRRENLEEEVLNLFIKHHDGITARHVQRARIAHNAEEAHALLDELASKGCLVCSEISLKNGGKVSKIYKPVKS